MKEIYNTSDINSILSRINWDYFKLRKQEASDELDWIYTANLHSLYNDFDKVNKLWLKYDITNPQKSDGTSYHFKPLQYLKIGDILILNNKYYVQLKSIKNINNLTISYLTFPSNKKYRQMDTYSLHDLKKVKLTNEIKKEIEFNWLTNLIDKFFQTVNIPYNKSKIEYTYKNKYFGKMQLPKGLDSNKYFKIRNKFNTEKKLNTQIQDNYLYFYKS